MPVIDLDTLLTPISEDNPAGPNLDDETVFMEMEQSAEGQPEREASGGVRAAVPPDWKALKTKSTEILKQSKDFRAAVFLARALLHTDGFQGFGEGLALLSGMIEQHWETMHPVLEPEEKNDPTYRLNILSALNESTEELGLEKVDPPVATLRAVLQTPLVAHSQAGTYSLRDVQIANGEMALPPKWEGDPPDNAVIEAAFMKVELEELQATADAIGNAIDQAKAIDGALLERVELTQIADLLPLTKILIECQKAIAAPLARRGAPVEGIDGEGTGDGDEGGQPGTKLAGEVTSRDDVVRAIDKICDFYSRTEPSSPIPILLKRARRLVAKDFMEIIRDLTPGGVNEMEKIRGKEE